MARPVVDRMERELENQAKVLRIEVTGQVGRMLVQQYGVRAVPTFLVFDGNGRVVYTQVGLPDREAIASAVAQTRSQPR